MTKVIQIRTTVTETTKVEKDVTIPYYFKDEYRQLCKIISTTHFIAAKFEQDYWSIQVYPVKGWEARIGKGEEITEDQYNEAFENAKMYIEQLNSDEPQDMTEDENVQIDNQIYGRAI
jgi:hypothetical protein